MRPVSVIRWGISCGTYVAAIHWDSPNRSHSSGCPQCVFGRKPGEALDG